MKDIDVAPNARAAYLRYLALRRAVSNRHIQQSRAGAKKAPKWAPLKHELSVLQSGLKPYYRLCPAHIVKEARADARRALSVLEATRRVNARCVNSKPLGRVKNSFDETLRGSSMTAIFIITLNVADKSTVVFENKTSYPRGQTLEVGIPIAAACRLTKLKPYLNNSLVIKRGDEEFLVIDAINPRTVGSHHVVSVVTIQQQRDKSVARNWSDPVEADRVLAILPTRDDKKFIVGIGKTVEEAQAHTNILLRAAMRRAA